MTYVGRSQPLPNLDVLSLLFDSPLCLATEDLIVHAEAANPSNSITKSQARTLTKRLAYGLRHSYGIGASGPDRDVVIVFSSGQILLPILLYAVLCTGGVYSAASSAYTTPELARQVEHGGANLIVCSSDLKDVAIAAAKQCRVPLSRVLVLESGPERKMVSIEGGQDCFSDQELGWAPITDPNVLENSIACLLYSSGTTGLPKGVRLSHANLVSEAMACQLIYQGSRPGIRDPHFQYRTLAHLPSSHIAGLLSYSIAPILASGIVYWMPRFDFLKFVEYCQKYEISYLLSVPPIYLLIAKSPLVTNQFKSVKHAVTAAAPMGAELQKLTEEKLGCILNQTWGMTETTGSVTGALWHERDDTGSVNSLLTFMKLRIADEEYRDVVEGEPGEILVMSPVVTKGYFRNEQASKDAFTEDGWFRTGDVGAMRNGRLYLIDRKKELIKYKGHQVAPAELEALLLSHALITDAAVIGVPESPSPSNPTISSGNELPRAYVVISPANRAKIDESAIKAFVKTRLAPHKQLRGGVVFVDAIPKSPAGKILRRELRARAQKVGGVGAKL